MHIYIENDTVLPQIYCITEQMIRAVLPEAYTTAQITVRMSDQRDLSLLQTSDVFVGSGFDTGVIGRNGQNLKLIQCLTAGVEAYLPLDWVPAGAAFTNSSGIQAEKIAIFGPMAILMLNESIPKYATDQRQRRWRPAFSSAIRGKTALFYGFGAIGQAMASQLRALGVHVVAIRRSGEGHAAADEMHGPAMLHDLLPRADFLVLCCPLTQETRGLIGEHELGLLPRGAGVLNIARGPVLDNGALGAALESGHVSGAILDVFDPEPLAAESELWDVPNLMILPHISCDDSNGYIARCLSIFGDNLARLAAGAPLRNVVDPAREY